jgi:hypothetical protein
MPGHYLQRIGSGVPVYFQSDYRFLGIQPIIGVLKGGEDRLVQRRYPIPRRASGRDFAKFDAAFGKVGLPATGRNPGRSKLLL